MANGDRAGLAMLRDSSAWIGVRRDNGVTRVSMTNGLTMDSNWNTTGTGTEAASADLSGGRIWLRVNADIRPGTGRQARFSYSTDGIDLHPARPGVHAQQRLAVLHGLPLRASSTTPPRPSAARSPSSAST